MSVNHFLLPVLFLTGMLAQAGTGILELDSNPGGAEVFVDGKKKGVTPEVEGKALRIELDEGDRLLEVSKTGYTKKTSTLFIGDRVTAPHTVTLIPEPPGSAAAASTPVVFERPWLSTWVGFDHEGGGTSSDGSGYIDRHGREVVAPIYDRVDPVSFVGDEEYIVVETRGYVRGFLVNRDGKQVFPVDDGTVGYEDRGSGLYLYKQVGGLCGFVNIKGEMVISPQYGEAQGFCSGVAPVKVNGQWGLIDQTGKMVVQPAWEFLSFTDSSILRMSAGNGRTGLMDTSGKIIVQPNYDSVNDIVDDHVVVSLRKKYGVTDRAGRLVISLEWDAIEMHTSNKIAVKKKGRAGVMNIEGAMIIPLEWEDIKLGEIFSDFGEELYFVKRKGKWGAINREQEVRIPLEWDAIEFPYREAFRKDLIFVQKNAKWSAINGKGEALLPTSWAHLKVGRGEYFRVGTNDDKTEEGKRYRGIIDSNGKVVIPIEWSDVFIYGTDGNPNEVWFMLDKAPRHPADVYVRAWADKNGKVLWKSESSTTPSGRTPKPVPLATLKQDPSRVVDEKPQIVLKRPVFSKDREKVIQNMTRADRELGFQMLFICCPEYFMEPTFSTDEEKKEKINLGIGFAMSMAALVTEPESPSKAAKILSDYITKKLVSGDDFFSQVVAGGDKLTYKHHGTVLLNAVSRTLKAKKLKRSDFAGKPIFWFASHMREVLTDEELQQFDTIPTGPGLPSTAFLDGLSKPRFSNPEFLNLLKNTDLYSLPHLAYEVREPGSSTTKMRETGRSPELQRELDAINEKLKAAFAAKDYPAQFDLSLRVLELLNEPKALDVAVTANYSGINPAIHDVAAGLSATWLERSKRCPEPGSQSGDMVHLQFFMVKFALATHYHNIQQDMTKAAETLAVAEPHFQIARTSTDKDLTEMAWAGVEKDIDDMKAMIRRNGLVEVYNKAVAGIKKMVAMVPSARTGAGDTTADSSKRTPDAPKSSGEKAPEMQTNGSKPQFTHYAGRTISFTIQSLGNTGADLKDGLSAQGGWVNVYDSSQDRKLSFNYDKHLDSKEGHKVSVEFDRDGKPVRFNNLSTGKSAGIRDAY